jgi:serine/threonine protein kinase
VFPDYVPISNCAKDFIYKALQKNPNSRIEMDELLNHPFLASSKRQEYMRHLNE